MTIRTAKLFTNGRSQAVRLPRDFRFPGREVLIRKDEETGEVILSTKPAPTWQELFAFRDSLDLDIPEDWLGNRNETPERDDPLG